MHLSIGYDQCETRPESGPNAWPPLVYSVNEHLPLIPSPKEFHLTHNLTECPAGFIAKTSTQFRLYEDGSVDTSDGKFQPAQFCIEQSKVDGVVQPQLVARFCVRDPCTETECIRKCCPDGMAMNLTSKLCAKFADDFIVAIRNENGSDAAVSIETVRHGAPHCSTPGFNALDPSAYEEDEFYVIPSGDLYVPAYPKEDRVLEEYCIDRFFDEKETVSCMFSLIHTKNINK